MSQPLSGFLDSLGRFPHKNLYGANQPAASALSSDALKAENLFKIWSPKPQSPWFPYAKATLFASADSNDRLTSAVTGMVSRPLHDKLQSVSGVSWVSSGMGIIVDLPQDESVIVAEFFARCYGFQPVALFNNWPHVRGLVNCEIVLHSLIALASQMGSASKISPQSPPIFMTENSRLGYRQPNEDDFDNRYFLSEEDLPPSNYLRQHGINQIYYIYRGTPGGDLLGIQPKFLSPGGIYIQRTAPDVETDDLNPYFCTLAKEGIELSKVSVETLEKSEPFLPETRKTVLSNFSLFKNSSFRRAAAGGFGALVPPRSSGG